MKKSPNPYLHHIIDAATSIEEYVSGVSYEQFAVESMRLDAVVRQLEIIGESCSNLESAFRDSHPSIPWSDIVGMRNRLAHEYWDVDAEMVWVTATEDVPQLRRQISEVLALVEV